MGFFDGLGSTRANLIGIAVIISASLVFLFTKVLPDEDHQAAMLAAWDRGEGRPAAVDLVHRSDMDTVLVVPKTISMTEVNQYWKTCPRGCWNHKILRYPFVYRIRTLYENAKVTGGPPANQCWAFILDNPVEELRIASTTSGLTVTYPRDGKSFVVCYPSPEGPPADANVVVWSDLSPFDYASL